jgi:hypothetical protein
MDKLERYLDQVCRGIAGPRSLRQHLRQELREHLRDAAAEHQAAGMTEAEALDRALEDFGGPEQVGTELAAEHGHRVMAVVIDKAMQWKERTMKARWLWTACAHVTLALLIAGQVAFISAAMVFVMPKVKQIVMESQWGGSGGGGAVVEGRGMDPYLPGSQAFLDSLEWVSDHAVLLIAALAVAWALFEWRVRGENKPFIRLSAMATTALLLMGASVMSAAVVSLPVLLVVPAMNARPPEQAVADLTQRLDASADALNRAIARNDWPAIDAHAENAARILQSLNAMGATPLVLAQSAPGDPSRVGDLRNHLREARRAMDETRAVAASRDPERVESAARKFQAAYQPIRAAAAATTAPTTKPAP